MAKRGPYTVWTDYGMEGWKPEDFPTFDEALLYAKQGLYGEWVIQKEVVLGEVVPEGLK